MVNIIRAKGFQWMFDEEGSCEPITTSSTHSFICKRFELKEGEFKSFHEYKQMIQHHH